MTLDKIWLETQYINLEKSERQIAKENNLTRGKIRYWKIKHEIPSRNNHEINSGKFKKGHIPWHIGNNGYIGRVPIWKNWNDLQINTRHCRIYLLKKKPKNYEICGKEKKLQLSNKDHKYSENLNDWLFVCRLCHEKYHKEHKLKWWSDC